jgi:hypothetical protein
LRIKHYFQTPDDSISKILNCIVPLQKLTKLVIQSYDFPFAEIVKLIGCTPNLYILKFSLSCLYETNFKLIEQSDIFQYVSKRNQIKNLDLHGDCTLEKIQLIVRLFPQLEYLKSDMNKKELAQILRFLLSKTNMKTRHLFFLCISKIPKRCLRELNILIKSEQLLDDYLIQFINRDLYLWW